MRRNRSRGGPRRRRAGLGPFGFLVAVVLATPGSATAADPDAVARGAYLAGAAGCGRCHTDADANAPAYAGGRRLKTAFGTLVTPNITPDRATGIGGWSDADFARAMRWGIAPDDSHYVPAFPFPFYNRLTERDLADLKAFLDSLPAASRPGTGAAASPALFERARAAAAVAASGMPGPWRDDPARDAVWNRGAYLAATLGRCGDCHTPRTWLGTPDQARFFAGAPDPAGGKKAPNITSDKASGIGHWSTDDIATMLTDGTTPNFDEVGGGMAEIVKNTAQLTAEDRRAIAVFLQSVPPVSTPDRK